MIALLLSWTFLFFISLALGGYVLRRIGVASFGATGDRTLLAVWMGYLLLGSLLLCLALIMPLSRWVGVACLLGAGLIYAFSHGARQDVRTLFGAATGRNALVYLLTLLAAAVASVKYITNRDAISYHFDIVNWLSTIGIQPGLALIHNRFANISTWYTVPAMQNHDLLYARVGALGNGFALFLIGCHLMLALTRLANGKGQRSDVFMAAAIPLSISFPLLLNYTLSPSPDFAVTVLALVLVWVFLAQRDAPDMKPRESLVPLVLGACAVAVKLSALPLLLVAGLYHLVCHRFKFSSIMVAGLVTGLLLLPNMIAGIIVSGCPFYPMPICIDTPWSVGAANAVKESASVLNFARWGFSQAPDIPYLSWAWLKHWLAVEKTHIVGLALFTLSIGSSIWLVRFRRQELRVLWPLLSVGIVGMVLLIIKAPTPRFGWTYLTVIPCALVMLYITLPRRASAWLARCAVIVVVLQLALPDALWATKSERRMATALQEKRLDLPQQAHLIVPPVIPHMTYDDQEGVVHPNMMHAEARNLRQRFNRPMYYPLTEREGTAYREPNEGAAKGFVRVSQP